MNVETEYKVDIYTPVFKRPWDHNRIKRFKDTSLTALGKINSTPYPHNPETAQYLMSRQASLYACYDKYIAAMVYLSHFEKETRYLTEEEILAMPFLHIYADRFDEVVYDESYPAAFTESEIGGVKEYLGLHFYNMNRLDISQHRIWRDLDYYIKAKKDILVDGLHPRNRERAEGSIEFFETVYCDKDPQYTISDYDVIDVTKGGNGYHYVYTLSDPLDNRVFYVGYTCNPKARFNQHIFSQTNIYLQSEINGLGKYPKMNIVHRTKNYQKALNYETDMIEYYGQFGIANIRSNPYGATSYYALENQIMS